MREQSLIRRLRRFLKRAHVLRTDSCARKLPLHRTEVIEVRLECLAEFVDERHAIGTIEAHVPEIPPHDVTVALLDVHVVVLPAGLRARERDTDCIAVFLRHPIDEFRSCVGMEFDDRHGTLPLDVLQVLHGRTLPLVPLRAEIVPIQAHVDSAQNIDEIAEDGIAAERHRVDLLVPGRQVLPRPFEYGNDVFERRGFGRRLSLARAARFLERLRHPPHRAHAHGTQFVRHGFVMIPHIVSHEDVDVLADHRMQIFAATFIRSFPYLVERAAHVERVVCIAPASFTCARIAHLYALERTRHSLRVYVRNRDYVRDDLAPLLLVFLGFEPCR